MKNNIIFNNNTLVEYKNASIWYELQQVGLGIKFEHAIQLKPQIIDENPFIFSFKKGKYREAKIEKFPYGIVYKYNEIKQEIYVSGIYHTSRNPKGKFRKGIH